MITDARNDLHLLLRDTADLAVDLPQRDSAALLLGEVDDSIRSGSRFCEETLLDDRLQHSEAIAECPQVALSEDPLRLEARHLDDGLARLGDSNVDQRFDLEAVAPMRLHRRVLCGRQGEGGDALPTEGIVAV